MRLPKDLLSGIYTKPNLYLCETDKTKICKLETTETSGAFKFNSYSELSCTVSRTYTDMITGEQKVNPFYDKIEALRVLYLEGFGYFEIQDPELVSDGIHEVKNITAYSLEYSLSQKYLDGFYVNTGEYNSLEVTYAKDLNIDGKINYQDIESIVFYNPSAFTEYEQNHSLLHLVLQKAYGWSIGHVDATLMTMTRKFEVDRATIYDFIMQDICDKFGCFVEFDTEENKINFYSESPIVKFKGDGVKTLFEISPAFDVIDTVSIDSFKTTKYTYNVINNVGQLTLEEAPEDNATIEVVDGSQQKYSTDVYVSFDNLAQEVNVSYSADDIKTVLTVKGADDLNIREVNMGLAYITDLSYYYSVDWMGQDLYDAYTAYMEKCKEKQDEFTNNSKEMSILNDKIAYETTRLSLEYSIAPNVTPETIGEYYIRGGDKDSGYYYVKVSLNAEYSASVENYYTLSGNDLTEEKFANFYKAICTYYKSQTEKNTIEIVELKDQFKFMEVNTIDSLVSALSNADSVDSKDTAIKAFLDELWNQLGLTPLEGYKDAYEGTKKSSEEDGWNDQSNFNYWDYYPLIVIVNSLNDEINEREEAIKPLRDNYNNLQIQNNQMQNDLVMDVFFKNYCVEELGLSEQDASAKTSRLLARLNPFLREDEYTDDNFMVTDSDSIEDSIKVMQELLECGKIELSKLSSPKLAFSMDMANIYALPEFAPIVWQFQLGNLINVAIRKDYIKRARLLQVNINFDDFSDFSCEFGELTSLRTSSSIHADLLAQALSAGKSVASNSSYWHQGADFADSTTEKIQQGLLYGTNGLFTSDQGITIDSQGIKLTKIDQSTGEVSPYQAWLKNNTIMLSSDGFQSSRMGLGEFKVEGTTFYGVIAEAVLSGYIESSKIVGGTMIGGTINIGNGTFLVDSNGNVTMNAASIAGYVEEDGVISSINQSPESVVINANRISLAGKEIDLTSDNITIDSTNFSVTKEGNITATGGEIAGWTIYDNLLRKELTIDNVDYQMYMQAPNGTSTTNAFAVRKKDSGDTDWDVQFSVNYAGKMTAKNAHITGTIVAQDGSIAGYNIGPGGSYSDAIYRRVSGNSSDYEVGLKATSGDTDLAFYVKESTDNWGSSSNTFYVRNNGQLYAKNADITGEINATSGNIGGCTISNGVLNVGAANITSGTIATARIPNLSADKITAGVIDVDRIPNLNANKITVGTLNADRIPNISANKITSGTIDASAVTVTNLNASNITSGTLNVNRLSSSVITTGNFSSKELSTGNLTVTGGSKLGFWTVTSSGGLTCGSGTSSVGMSSSGVSHGSGWTATWYDIIQAGNAASDERLKTDIAEFEDGYGDIFDNLKPVKFRYTVEPDRLRFGFIAQDVKENLEAKGINDFGGIYIGEGDDTYYRLLQEDFIALNTWQIQKLKARVEELENKLASLES